MDIKVNGIYVTKKNIVNSSKNMLLKGHKVRVISRSICFALVKDLECKKLKNEAWLVYIDDLVPCEEEHTSNNYDQHYQGKVEPIELMQAQMTQAELIGFLKGNIIKYATRCGKKDDPAKEVAKIKRYADWLLDVLEGRTIDPRS